MVCVREQQKYTCMKERTLYKLKQNELALAVVPSNAFVKLSGFSIFILPPRATKPVMIMNTKTKILKIPRKFCNLNPHLSAVPWRSTEKVMHAKPTSRSVQRVGSTFAARRMYSPKTSEFPAAQARRRALAEKIDVMRNLGLRNRYSR